MIDRLGSFIRQSAIWMVVAGLAVAVSLSAAKGAGRPQDDTGKKVFESNCIGCHGPDGSGTPLGQSLMAPDLRSDKVQSHSDDDFKKQVSEGKNSMPAFKDTLGAAEIQAVVAYVRTFAAKK